MKVTDAEADALSRIRRRRRVARRSLWFLPAVPLVFFLLDVAFDSPEPKLIGGAIVAALFLAPSMIHAMSACPRCHNLFYYTAFWGNPFGTRCRHCGLELPRTT